MDFFIDAVKKPVRFTRDVLSKRKIINNVLLNVLGLQLLRILFARARLSTRVGSQASKNTYVRDLLTHGYCVIENFLPEEQFQNAKLEFAKEYQRKECVSLPSPDEYGVVSLKVVHNHSEETWKNHCNGIYESFIKNSFLLETIAAAHGVEKRYLEKVGVLRFKLERVYTGDEIGNPDTEPSVCNFHTDTFHSITKGFYYLTEVNNETTPFIYCPDSHKLSFRRLMHEWRNSVTLQEGAPFIKEEVIKSMGFEFKQMCLPANTLILADTFGFHARGKSGTPGISRDLIHVDYRPHPFNQELIFYNNLVNSITQRG